MMDEREKTVEDAKAKRQLIWKHNSFFGHCGMARQNMQAIIDSSTATAEAKGLASYISSRLVDLGEALKERKPL